jgi:Zn-dependent M28 family amino/carboxypeptidase
MLKSAFSPSGRLPERGSLSLTMLPFEVTTHNVIGVLPGTDPKLSKEVVVVGAHLDHLGMGGASSLSDSKSPAIHHGADDNASGTSALIEIASILSSPANRPKRTVVFIAFSGEELGLLGSVHYVKNPVYAIKDTVAMVNLDMVGRMKDKSRLSLIGVKTSPGWESVVSPLVKRSGLNVVLEDSTSGGSDHQPFQAAKVPVTFFFTGLHADYHRPSDTVDKLDIDGIAKVSQLAARVVERVADARERLVFSEPPAAAGGSSTMRAKASLGTIPEYGAGVIGVLVGGVRAGSPAEKAGLQAGDILVGFAGKTIRSIEEYTAALGEANPGDVVELKVDRKGKILLMKATLAESRR